MQDFEKLGAFYLGRRFDTQNAALTDELTLYDAKDLTTHGVIIGMTGSGKTGLGVGLIEEAALDKVPVIAVDPKGDLGNLLLTFPELAPKDFEPWIDASAALESGKTTQEQAAATAAMWQKGLADWGQSKARIRKLRDSAQFDIYTPGSTVGKPISVLRSLSVDPALTADGDALRERIQSTVQCLLTLLDIDADPLTSREHILLSNILSDYWSRGASLSLAELIAAVQKPPMQRVGVMEIETFYPASERFALAMRINNLLAAPGFEVWTQGQPLNIGELLYTQSGQPRVTILSIAHLSDSERMFFVTALLTELVSWMRMQSGTPSLRALFYMDEVFGYLPPVANPPCKPLMLTLLKQARAYGLGLLLATQNPIDLDYKALSNIGTWMIGRLQTRRDIDRIRNGLEAAAGADNLAGEALDETLAAMRKRCFLLHNVHEKSPTIFQTRWVMSYLAGPLTAQSIRKLSKPDAQATRQPESKALPESATRKIETRTQAPILGPKVQQFFLPAVDFGSGDGELTWLPRLLVSGNVLISRARPPVETKSSVLAMLSASGKGRAPEWDSARRLGIDVDKLVGTAVSEGSFAPVPDFMSTAKSLQALETPLRRWLRTKYSLTIYRSPAHRCYSNAGESEGEFRARLQSLGNEQRDLKIAALRKKYETKLRRLQTRLERANLKIAEEHQQASTQKLDTAITFGTAILGALLGRRTAASTSARRVGNAIRKAGRSRQQATDVVQAKAAAAAIQAEVDALAIAFEDEIDALDGAYDASSEKLTSQRIKARLADIDGHILGVVWEPARRDASGALVSAVTDELFDCSNQV